MNAQHVEASAAQRRSDMIRRAADQAEVTNRIVTQFFPIGADTEDLTAFTDDQSRGFDEAMLFALEDKIDPAAAAVRCAHDVEERAQNIAGRNDADEMAVGDHGQAADLSLQHDLGRFFDGSRRGYGNRVRAHDVVDFDLFQMTAVLAQIAIADDADEPAVAHYRQTAKPACLHLVHRADR